ncbi:sensor histidine kinase [Streptomyces silvisoli]|uniref:histidine kinase n=1 Tax=Streptomyces silvisoli TaxID=3034235 RepID=A0ABT5ZD43_9ACTN|nr:HAMP domain-containing sensor histidine kinase [Streptomyces silvisoli]MDF3287750.1 HAMP domain-containing sensor histidine kinase [Streptomyces silvisoli]
MVRRLLLSYLTLALLVLLALEIPFGIVYARSETSTVSTSLERDVVVLAELVEEDVETSDARELPALLAKYAHRAGTRVTIVDRHGNTLADSASAAAGPHRNLLRAPDIAAALRNQRTSGTMRDAMLGGEVYYSTAPVAYRTTVGGAVRLSAPTFETINRIHTAWMALAAAALAVLSAMTVIGFALARWITRPVRELERATAQLADGSLTEPPAVNLGPPELRRLASEFTRTAARLQHLLRAQHRFAADASHQLKTPLTALRLRLENLEPDLHPHAQHNLDSALSEIDRLVRMIQGLLALARAESSETAPVPVDPNVILSDRADTWNAFATDRGIGIALAGDRVGRVWAVPGALEQIVDNLLANALRAAPPGTTVTLAHSVAAGRDSGHAYVEIHVTDEGPGMSDVERANAFDRFWRAPNASPDGTGLGLAIAQQLAHASGGDIELRPAAGGGLDAVIRLRPIEPGRRHRHRPFPATPDEPSGRAAMA